MAAKRGLTGNVPRATNGHLSRRGLVRKPFIGTRRCALILANGPRLHPGKCKREADGGGHSTGGQPNRRTNDTISEAFSFEVIETGAGHLAAF